MALNEYCDLTCFLQHCFVKMLWSLLPFNVVTRRIFISFFFFVMLLRHRVSPNWCKSILTYPPPANTIPTVVLISITTICCTSTASHRLTVEPEGQGGEWLGSGVKMLIMQSLELTKFLGSLGPTGWWQSAGDIVYCTRSLHTLVLLHPHTHASWATFR